MKRVRPLVMGTVLAVATAACGSVGGETSEDEIVIGFSQHRIAGSDWYKHLIEGARDQAERQGVSVTVADAGGDAVQQSADLRNLITRGADGIVVNALDPRGLGAVFEELSAEQIPYVAVNSKLSGESSEMAYCFVAEDQPATAGKVGEELASIVEDKFGPSDKVTTTMVGGYSGEVTTRLRKEGFLEAYQGSLKGSEGPEVAMLPIRYGEWLPDQAREPVQQQATANPGLDILFSMSDVMLPGIKQGLRQAGVLEDTIIGSYDGAMSTIKEMMENPSGPVQATVSNTPYLQGAAAVQMAIDAVKGEPAESACPGGEFNTPGVLITADNAAKYYEPELGPYWYPREAVKELAE